MLLLVGPPERSTARNNCPVSPAGLIPPPPSWPPRLTAVFRSKVGVWPPICALLERTQRNDVPPLQPPIKRLPLVSTSSVPYTGALGIAIGDCQVVPPFVERWNATALLAQLA